MYDDAWKNKKRKPRLQKKLHVGPWQVLFQRVDAKLPLSEWDEAAQDQLEDGLLELHDRHEIYVGFLMYTQDKSETHGKMQIYVEANVNDRPKSKEPSYPAIESQVSAVLAYLQDNGLTEVSISEIDDAYYPREDE